MSRYLLIGAVLALLFVEVLALGLTIQRIDSIQAMPPPVRKVIGKFLAWNFVNRPRLNAKRRRPGFRLRSPAVAASRMALTQGPD